METEEALDRRRAILRGKLLTLSELVARWGVSLPTARAWIARMSIPRIVLSEKIVRYRVQDVAAAELSPHEPRRLKRTPIIFEALWMDLDSEANLKLLSYPDLASRWGISEYLAKKVTAENYAYPCRIGSHSVRFRPDRIEEAEWFAKKPNVRRVMPALRKYFKERPFEKPIDQGLTPEELEPFDPDRIHLLDIRQVARRWKVGHGTVSKLFAELQLEVHVGFNGAYAVQYGDIRQIERGRAALTGNQPPRLPRRKRDHYKIGSHCRSAYLSDPFELLRERQAQAQ